MIDRWDGLVAAMRFCRDREMHWLADAIESAMAELQSRSALREPVEIATDDDLGLLHEALSDLGWPCVSAETEHGQPLLVFEAEDGEMYATDGSGEPVMLAESVMPFRVLSPAALAALDAGSGDD